MPSFGGVVEGAKDEAVCDELIRMISPGVEQILFRVAGNKPQLMKKFPGLLHTLGHVTVTGGPVDKAIVIRDADNKDVPGLEEEMQRRMAGRTYPFPGGVAVHAIRQEIDTWLLVDLGAINAVAAVRGSRQVKRRVPRPLEDIQQPSLLLQDILSDAGLNYTAEVFRQLAARLDPNKLRAECPSFAAFEQKILDP